MKKLRYEYVILYHVEPTVFIIEISMKLTIFLLNIFKEKKNFLRPDFNFTHSIL